MMLTSITARTERRALSGASTGAVSFVAPLNA